MNAIEIVDLCKSFKNIKVIDHLNLNVPKGSVYGFLGQNGAGKTTVMKMLANLIKPTGGEIKIFGKNVDCYDPKISNKIGFLPENPRFYDWMKPVEYMKFCGELFRIEKKVLDKRVGKLLNNVGLSGINKKIGSFSEGMKQRLGVAQTLINEPNIIFMDEPAGGLEPFGRKEVLDIISTLSKKATVFFSTNNLLDVENVCDRVAILESGKIILEGRISKLKQKFAAKMIFLEIERAETMDEFFSLLKEEQWVTNINKEGSCILKIYVNDINKAKLVMPQLISTTTSGIRNFIILEPSLEDIFLKVVS